MGVGEREDRGVGEEAMRHILVAVLAWHTVSSSNCYRHEPASCAVQRIKDAAWCERHPKNWCTVMACMSSRMYCDEVQLGLHEDKTVEWRVATSTEIWNAEMVRELEKK